MNRMTDDFRLDSRKSPEQLEREIDATRTELLATLEELEHRLSPTDLINQFWSQLRRHGGEYGSNLGRTLKDHPVPALIASIGLAWMMASSTRSHNGGSYGVRHGNGNGSGRFREAKERLREGGEQLGEHVREGMHGMRQRMHGMRESMRQRSGDARSGVVHVRERATSSGEHLRERARAMSSSARHGVARARGGLGHLLEEQPLLLGAIGLAAGVIAGAALPPTEHEDRAFGRIRDRALDRAKRAGAEGARRARERAETAAESLKDALPEDQGMAPKEHTSRTTEPSSTGTSTSSPGTGLGY